LGGEKNTYAAKERRRHPVFEQLLAVLVDRVLGFVADEALRHDASEAIRREGALVELAVAADGDVVGLAKVADQDPGPAGERPHEDLDDGRLVSVELGAHKGADATGRLELADIAQDPIRREAVVRDAGERPREKQPSNRDRQEKRGKSGHEETPRKGKAG